MQESTLENAPIVAGQQVTAIVIANPSAGSYIHYAQQIGETIEFLRHHGWQVELKLTHHAGEAQSIAHEAVEQHIQVVIAVGGDGTIHEIIQELAGSATALGVIPGGTVNVWAREVGIPLDHAGARDVLIKGCVRHIDLGQVNERYFLLMVGIGLDGEVTRAVEKKPVKRLGVIGYILVGTWLGLGYPDFRAVLELDGRVIKVNALQIVIGNTQLYAGALKYTWQARCDDGLLDICIVRKQSVLGRCIVALDFLLRREQRRQWVRYETARTISIQTRRLIAMQEDGEAMGYTATKDTSPTIFKIVPRALKVIVPRTTSQELFSQHAGENISLP